MSSELKKEYKDCHGIERVEGPEFDRLSRLIANRYRLYKNFKITKIIIDNDFGNIVFDVLHYDENGKVIKADYYMDGGFIEEYRILK